MPCDSWHPIPVDFGPASDGIDAGWLTAHEPDRATFSPGPVRLRHLIEALCATGIRTFNLGKGDQGDTGTMATGWTEIAEGWIGHRGPASSARRADVVPRGAAGDPHPSAPAPHGAGRPTRGGPYARRTSAPSLTGAVRRARSTVEPD